MKPGWSGTCGLGNIRSWHILFHLHIHCPPQPPCLGFSILVTGCKRKRHTAREKGRRTVLNIHSPNITLHLACYKSCKPEHLWTKFSVIVHSVQETVIYIDQPLSYASLCKGHWCVSMSCREISLFRVIFPLSPHISAVWVSEGKQLIRRVEKLHDIIPWFPQR